MMDTDQVPAGRELDALVAEKVMGWSRKTGVDGWDDMWPPGENGNIERRVTAPGFGGLPHYSTDVAAAWKVVEKLHQSRFIVRLSISNGQYGWSQRWEIAIWRSVHRDSGLVVENCRKIPHEERREVSFKAEADSVLLAICHVALKATKERV
jgi:hypothetical protein